MMFTSTSKYEPGHYDGDGCVFPDPGHFNKNYIDRQERMHLQSNEILADIRRYRTERLRMNNPKDWAFILRVFKGVEERGFYVTNDWKRITSPEMIYHTAKVLTRLANLEKVSA